jgi:hypothetical protein
MEETMARQRILVICLGLASGVLAACDIDLGDGGTEPEVCDLGWEEACAAEGFLCESTVETPTRTVFSDGDLDLFGDANAPFEIAFDAEVPPGAATFAGDCNDDLAAANPTGSELDACAGGVDDDCDGTVDCADWECNGAPSCTVATCAAVPAEGSGEHCLPVGTINTTGWDTIAVGDEIPTGTPSPQGDIDGDGILDEVFERESRMFVHFGLGTGGFEDEISLGGAHTYTSFGSVSADTDLSGDGVDDVVVRYARYIRVYFGRARDGAVDWEPDVTIGDDCRARGAERVPNIDADGDGDTDLVVLLGDNASPCTSCYVEPGLFVFDAPLTPGELSFGTPVATFANTRTVERVKGRGVSIDTAVILEGDGRLWALGVPFALSGSLEGTAVLGDDGTGTLSFLCDVDADGSSELVSVGGSRLTIRTVTVGDEQVALGDPREVELPAITVASAGLAGLGPDACLPDMNGDGLPELALFSFAPVGYAPSGIHVRYSPWDQGLWGDAVGFSVTDTSDYLVDLDVIEGSGGSMELQTATLGGTRRRFAIE